MANAAKMCEILHSNSTQYNVMEYIGSGAFGIVASCLNVKTNNMVAVKIPNDKAGKLLEWEIHMLKKLRTLDPDKAPIVKCIESFNFQNVLCLAFEMLDMSLMDLILERRLTLNEIRPVTYQLMVALEALKSVGIMHNDLKPDNIMLVNHTDQPFRIKLIDFGLALPVSMAQTGMLIQVLSFRAPEVTLGLPVSTAADMWAVGCIMAHMYFGQSLFPNQCKYYWMQVMLHMLGHPDNCLLNSAINTSQYFSWEPYNKVQWRFKTPEEYCNDSGIIPDFTNWHEYPTESFIDLEDAVHNLQQRNDSPIELSDKIAFLSLLKACLTINPEERISPRDALNHRFLTMTHLCNSSTASQSMVHCPKLTQVKELYRSPNAEIDHGSENTGAESPKPIILFSESDILAFFGSQSSEKSELHFTSSEDKSSKGDTSSSSPDADNMSKDEDATRFINAGNTAANEEDVPSEHDGAKFTSCSDEFNISTVPDEAQLSTVLDAVLLKHLDGLKKSLEGRLDAIEASLASIQKDFGEVKQRLDQLSTVPDRTRVLPVLDTEETSTVLDTEETSPVLDTEETSPVLDTEKISTVPDGRRPNSFCKKVRKFFGRMKKRVLSICICGKTED